MLYPSCFSPSSSWFWLKTRPGRTTPPSTVNLLGETGKFWHFEDAIECACTSPLGDLAWFGLSNGRLAMVSLDLSNSFVESENLNRSVSIPSDSASRLNKAGQPKAPSDPMLIAVNTEEELSFAPAQPQGTRHTAQAELFRHELSPDPSNINFSSPHPKRIFSFNASPASQAEQLHQESMSARGHVPVQEMPSFQGVPNFIDAFNFEPTDIKYFPAHNGKVLALVHWAEENRLISSAEDGTITVWEEDGTSVKTLAHLKTPAHTLKLVRRHETFFQNLSSKSKESALRNFKAFQKMVDPRASKEQEVVFVGRRKAGKGKPKSRREVRLANLLSFANLLEAPGRGPANGKEPVESVEGEDLGRAKREIAELRAVNASLLKICEALEHDR